MKKWKCDKCKKEVERFKDLKKVLKKKFCKKCYIENRLEKREERIENSPELKEDLRILKNKEAREYRVKRVGVRRKPGKPKVEEKDFPKIKGSKALRRKKKSSCYISLHEKQSYLRILMSSRGLSFEEAKERLSSLIESQRILRVQMKDKGRSEEQIKIKQQQMLEELWS